MDPFVPKLRVQREDVSPPTGWVCRVPETDSVFTGHIFSSIRDEVAEHLSANELNPEEAAARVHDSTGRALLTAGKRNLIERVEPPEKRTVAQYTSGAVAYVLQSFRGKHQKVLKAWFDRGQDPFVSQGEADRRAAICAECPSNDLPNSKGWLRKWTDGKMLQSVMGRKTSSHDALGVCKVCGGCELRAAVWWDPGVLKLTSPQRDFQKYPNECWKREILQPHHIQPKS